MEYMKEYANGIVEELEKMFSDDSFYSDEAVEAINEYGLELEYVFRNPFDPCKNEFSGVLWTVSAGGPSAVVDTRLGLVHVWTASGSAHIEMPYRLSDRITDFFADSIC